MLCLDNVFDVMTVFRRLHIYESSTASISCVCHLMAAKCLEGYTVLNPALLLSIQMKYNCLLHLILTSQLVRNVAR